MTDSKRLALLRQCARARAKANVWENFANSNQWLLAAPCAGVIGAPGGGGGVGGGVAA